MGIKRQGIQDMQQLIRDVECLKEIEEAVWTKPIDSGKWCIRDIISHIYLWDKYFYEKAIDPIRNGQPIRVESIPFDEFNRNAVEQGSKLTQLEMITLTIEMRSAIVSALEAVTETMYIQAFGEFTIESYIVDFVEHDRHHMQQIHNLLK